LAHARRYVKRGAAEFVDGKLRFFPKGHRARVDVIEQYATIQDSGFSGFLRYPQPSGGTGQKYRALAREGAGL
jgi:hypothetical protein